MSNDTPWISLADIPGTKTRQRFVVVFNDKTDELYALKQGEEALMQYLFDSNSWIKLKIEPPLNLKERNNDYREPDAPTAAINGDLIYFWNPYPGIMAKIQLFNNENQNPKSELIEEFPSYMGGALKGIIIDNEFHIIGHNQHWVYDESLNKFIFLHEMEENRKDIELFEAHGLIKANEKVLVFGGRSDPLDPTFEFDFGYTDTIRQYDILKDEWTKLSDVKVPEALQGIGCTTILNGKYVLLFGGEQVYDGGGSRSGDIHIYSVSNQTIRTSKIKCPQSGTYQAITRSHWKNDDMITNGYIRSELTDISMPICIVKIIFRYYFDEFVHVFHCDHDNRSKHHKISVFDILNK